MAFEDISVKIGAEISGFSKAMSEVESKMGSMGQKLSGAGQALATTFGAAGGAIAAGLGLAVNKSMDFEAQVSRVGAIAGATGSELDALRSSALELGASTSKSASEVAIAQEGLAALGMTATDIIAAMPGVISAAESSGADMAQTAEVMASALNIFGLEAAESTRVADILAQTANMSAADINDMGYALKYAGPVAANLGVSMEELSASIGIMTNAGLDGSSAGTALRAGLLSLLNPSEENSKMMEAMGIQMTDANGKFIGLSGVVQNLGASMEGMTDAQKTATLASLVGTEASSGFLALMNAGPAEIDKFTASLENSSGASATAAAAMKDNLKGAIEEMSGAFETMQISIGTALTPAIRAVAVVVTGLANAFNNLSPTMQQFIAIGAAVTAGVLLLVAGLGVLLMVAGSVMSGIAALGGAAAILSGALAVLTSPITLVIAGLVALGIAFGVLWAKSETFRTGVTQAFEAIKAAAIAVFEFIKPYITAAITAIATFVQEQLAKIQQFWQENGEQIMAVVESAWSIIQKVLEVALGIITALFEDVFLIIVEIVKTAWDVMTTIIETVTSVIGGIIKTWLAVFNGDWETAWETAKDVYKTIWEAIKSIVKTVLEAKQAIIERVLNAVKNFISNVLEGIKSIFEKIWSEIKGYVTNVMEQTKDKISEVWSQVKEDVSEKVTAIKTTVSNKFDDIKSSVTEKMDAVKQAIVDKWNEAKSAVEEKVNAIKTTVTTKFNDLKTAVTTAMSNVKTAIQDGWNNAVSFLEGIDLYSIGTQIIQGLINGIKGAADGISEAVSNITDKIPAVVKKIMGIHSPSRVMMEMGGYTGEGFAKGIANSDALVQKAVNDIASVPMSINPRLERAGELGNASTFQPTTNINVYSNRANPVEIAKRQRQEQRRLAAEWGV